MIDMHTSAYSDAFLRKTFYFHVAKFDYTCVKIFSHSKLLRNYSLFVLQKPEKPAWTGIWDATKYKPACPQVPWLVKQTVPNFNREEHTSEDCLYMNIFAPNVSTDSGVIKYFSFML